MAIINIILELLCSHLTCGLKLILAQEDHSLSLNFVAVPISTPPPSPTPYAVSGKISKREWEKKRETEASWVCL